MKMSFLIFDFLILICYADNALELFHFLSGIFCYVHFF